MPGMTPDEEIRASRRAGYHGAVTGKLIALENDGDAPTVAALQIRAPIVTVTSRARRSPSHPATGERSA